MDFSKFVHYLLKFIFVWIIYDVLYYFLQASSNLCNFFGGVNPYNLDVHEATRKVIKRRHQWSTFIDLWKKTKIH